MRELRFRCFWIRRKKMYPVEIISNGGACALLTTGKTHRWVVRGIEIMQSTGLKDKNGKEIYEGDILRGGEPIGGEPRISVIEWINTPYAACFNFGFLPAAHFCEVIGNIYENPELMEAK
jgi:hypothetical protein